MDEEMQFDAQDGAWIEDAGPNGTCKAEGTVVHYGRDQVPQAREASHII